MLCYVHIWKLKLSKHHKFFRVSIPSVKGECLDLYKTIIFFFLKDGWGWEIVNKTHRDLSALWIADPKDKYTTLVLNFRSLW